MTQPDVTQDLDTRGLKCPEPVMLLHKAIRNVQPGECIRMQATDPSTLRDVPKFCHYLGHNLLKQQEDDQLYTYWIVRKG